MYLGIDPGKTGAFAIIGADKKALTFPFDGFKAAYQILKLQKIEMAYIELVHIMPGNKSQSSTTFMKNAGAWEGLLEILSINHLLKPPQTWQKAIIGYVPKEIARGLDKPAADKLKREHKKKIKAKSVEMANRYFGLNLKSTQDGEADALNMALYAMRYHNGGL